MSAVKKMKVETRMKLAALGHLRVIRSWRFTEKRSRLPAWDMWRGPKPKNIADAVRILLIPKFGPKAAREFVRDNRELIRVNSPGR